ncbi:MAG: competence/damage-inducible protein A [Acidobacteria bacterium]|nr:competence/damage-inducible protein A [Acidobacteriota bacterium]
MTETAGTIGLRWAEIIAVGSELLVPPRVDTNSLFITGCLNELGIEVRAKTVVGDRRDDVAAVLRVALDRVELVVMCGGLGPTDDDLTRDAVAGLLAMRLVEDELVLDRIRQRFASRGMRMAETNRRQALVPVGAEVLPNQNGTAPGLWIERDGRILILLPGPPGELEPMFTRVAAERLAPRAGGRKLCRKVLRICGRTESEVEEMVFPTYSRWAREALPIATTVLTVSAQIELHLSVHADTEAIGMARLDDAARQVVAVVGADTFSIDGRALEQVVGDALRQRGWRIAVAESCTGGLISSRLTDVPGSSDYVFVNAVCYNNESKTTWLGVPTALIHVHGAVSEEVALAMADGVRERAGVEVSVGVTGIAGPTGGSERKPVGTVAIAAVTPTARIVRTFRFPGGRQRVKQFAAQMALDMVRRVLIGADIGGAFVVCGAPESFGS